MHRVVEKQAGVGNVWSLETLRRWLAQKLGKSDVATLKQYVDMLPQYLVRRFVSQERTPRDRSGRVPDKDASRCCRSSTQLNAGSTPCAPSIPAMTIAVDGPFGHRGAQQRRA